MILPTDTEEGGPRADIESYYTPTDSHTHTHTPVTPVSRPVQRRTLAWAEAQLKPRTPCRHHRGELTLTSEKCIFQCKGSEPSRARPWEIKRIIWHLLQSTGKLNLCSKCCPKAFVLFLLLLYLLVALKKGFKKKKKVCIFFSSEDHKYEQNPLTQAGLLAVK